MKITDHLCFEILGSTIDDAVGEAFDKVAKMMNLGFPGGPIIEKIAANGNPKRFNFPRPLYNQKNSDIQSIQELNPLANWKSNDRKFKNLRRLLKSTKMTKSIQLILLMKLHD